MMRLHENISRVKELMGLLNESDRIRFDFNELANQGVLWVTEPFVNGKKDVSNWEHDSNVVTLWNLKNPEPGQEWVFDAIKYPKNESLDWWTKEGQDSLSDEKYNQILRSIELKKEKSLSEGLHDTSWENEQGDKITLVDLLNATEDIPVQDLSVKQLEPHLLTWDGNDEEIAKIEKADLNYPVLIFVNDDGKFITIIDGHHRAQKAVRKGLDTIKAKVITLSSLPKKIKKVFSHLK